MDGKDDLNPESSLSSDDEIPLARFQILRRQIARKRKEALIEDTNNELSSEECDSDVC